MASILPFIRPETDYFDDRVTKILGDAFDAACEKLRDKGQPRIVHEVIARRVIDAATRSGCATSHWPLCHRTKLRARPRTHKSGAVNAAR